MPDTVADVLLARLREWDVRQVFGFPGDGINGLLAAWGRAGNKPQFVQARHEEMAAFEAVGFAKFSGTFGVCVATSGPGAVHLLNGLYDAKLDHVPVVAIVGQTSRSAIGGSYQQEVDLLTLFKDVASEYVQMVTVPEQLPNVLDRAIRVALTERTVTAALRRPARLRGDCPRWRRSSRRRRQHHQPGRAARRPALPGGQGPAHPGQSLRRGRAGSRGSRGESR